MTCEQWFTRAMEIGLGHLRLTPAAFWAMTMREYDAAQRGYLQSRGVDMSKRGGGMTRARLDELKRLYPDG